MVKPRESARKCERQPQDMREVTVPSSSEHKGAASRRAQRESCAGKLRDSFTPKSVRSQGYRWPHLALLTPQS